MTLASIRDCFVPDPFQFISDIIQFRVVGLYYGLMKALLNELYSYIQEVRRFLSLFFRP